MLFALLLIIQAFPIKYNSSYLLNREKGMKKTILDIPGLPGCIYGSDGVCTRCAGVSHAVDDNSESKTYGKCVECPQNCYNCKTPTTCSQCSSGYALDSNKNCVSCNVQHCSSCNDDLNSCTSCIKGYGLDTSSATPRCVPCLLDDCEDCSDDYTRCSNSCSTPNCLKCANYPYVGEICAECKDGYIMIMNNKCRIDDVQNCASYSAGGCSSCKGGYYLENNQCKKCKNDCYVYSYIECECGLCYPGNGFVDGVCKKCNDNNCNFCKDDNSDICEECKDGYYIKDDGKCSKMKDENCQKCYTSGTCYECKPGYGLINSICSKCVDPNCNNCDGNINICMGCKNGFRLNYKYNSNDYATCEGCRIDNCKYCYSDVSICNTCKDGYILKNNACEVDPSYSPDNDKDDDGNSNGGGKGGNDGFPKYLIGVIVACVVVVIIVIVVVVIVVKKKKANANNSSAQENEEAQNDDN